MHVWLEYEYYILRSSWVFFYSRRTTLYNLLAGVPETNSVYMNGNRVATDAAGLHLFQMLRGKRSKPSLDIRRRVRFFREWSM